MNEIRIYCFGHLRVEVGGLPDIHFETDKMRALLVYLAVENERPQTRSHLAGLFWSDQSELQAMHSLRQTLSSLRKKLEEAAPGQQVLLVNRDTVQVDPNARLWVDVHAFRSALKRAYLHYQRLDSGGWVNVRRLEQALAMKRGAFLSHFDLRGSQLFEEWLLIMREDLDQQAIKSLGLLAGIYEQRGEFALARQAAQQIIDIFPWEETAHVRLMRLFAVDHQWGAALNQYRILVRLLQDQLGVEPVRETTDLFEKIRSAAAGDRVDAFHKQAPNVHLPSSPAHFVGREQELDSIADLVVDPACRLLTILGPGGIGKTRLAVEAARQQVGVFGDGVFFVPLPAVTSGEQVYLAIADALGLTLFDESDPKTRVLAYLRDRRLLLVLDNYEHLLKGGDGTGTRPVVDILESSPGAKVLATSRERLMLREEWVFSLDGLCYPHQALPAGMTVEQALAQYDALALFNRQARKAQYGFVLNEENLADVTRICQVLEGFPLGIELAAATIWSQPCSQLAERIGAHFDALVSSASNTAQRHRSLRAAFDVSWELLDDCERALFCRLSVFRGGFTMEAAQLVAQAAPESLLALVNKSLLRRDTGGRFDMHAVIRQYAGERLVEADCGEEAGAAHARYFSQFLADQRMPLQGRNQKCALDNIQREIGNAAQAWQWMLANRTEDDLLACLDVLYQFFYMRSRFAEGMTWFQSALHIFAPEDNPPAQHAGLCAAMLLARLGGLAHYARENSLAFDALTRAHAILEGGDQPAELAFCQTLLAGVLLRRKEFDSARALAQRNLVFFQQSQDHFGECRSLYILGLIHNRLGKIAEAKAYLNDAVKAGQHLDNRRLLMAPYNLLGDIACIEGSYDTAERLFIESLHIAREVEDRFHQAIILNNLASVYHINRQYQAAQQSYAGSLEICRAIGDRDGEAMAMANLAELDLAQGDYTRALETSRQALAIARSIGEEWTIIASLNSLGEAACHLERYDQAMGFLTEAIQIAWKVQAVDQAARCLVNAGRVFQLRGDSQTAVMCYRAALAHSATEHEARERAQRWMEELDADNHVHADDCAVEHMLLQLKIIE